MSEFEDRAFESVSGPCRFSSEPVKHGELARKVELMPTNMIAEIKELRAEVERLREAGKELDDVIRRLSDENKRLREALLDSIP